jgi:hypothetical protein
MDNQLQVHAARQQSERRGSDRGCRRPQLLFFSAGSYPRTPRLPRRGPSELHCLHGSGKIRNRTLANLSDWKAMHIEVPPRAFRHDCDRAAAFVRANYSRCVTFTRARSAEVRYVCRWLRRGRHNTRPGIPQDRGTKLSQDPSRSSLKCELCRIPVQIPILFRNSPTRSA